MHLCYYANNRVNIQANINEFAPPSSVVTVLVVQCISNSDNYQE